MSLFFNVCLPRLNYELTQLVLGLMMTSPWLCLWPLLHMLRAFNPQIRINAPIGRSTYLCSPSGFPAMFSTLEAYF